MPKADRWTAVERWITDAQEALQITQWRVRVVQDAADIDAWADIDPHTQANTADLRLSHDFYRQDPEKQRLILTHELLHLVTCRTDRTVETLEEALGKIAWAVYEPQYTDATERMAEHLAAIIAPFLPLPKLPRA